MFKIGFCSEGKDNIAVPAVPVEVPRPIVPRKSVVQVSFPGYGRSLAYYNDKFDLRVGDLVYVDGKLEGTRGRVVEVNYNFKIKLSEYKRIIYLVDTEVHGEFFNAGSHFITFDPSALPAEKVRTWFVAPLGEKEEYASGSDDMSFPLENMNGMKASAQIASKGHEYYVEDRVKYLCLDGTHGFAIVQGTEPYEVEFEFSDGMVSCMTCSCFCSCNCKHEFAAMLKLRETLELIAKHYADRYHDYFAAISKGTLISVAVDGKETGRFAL